MAILNVSLATRDEVFPAGTVEDSVFVYQLTDALGAITEIQSAELSVQFVDVAPGEYVVSASKNGFAAFAPVSVPNPEVHIQVPDVLSVVLG